MTDHPEIADYYRRDQAKGITAPNLAKRCTYAEHIVSARGKRDQFTSVSLDPAGIRDIGEKLYQLLRNRLGADGHQLVEHGRLLESLLDVVRHGQQADRARAIQALRYAKKRKEGLLDWRFDISSVDSKDLVHWTYGRIQEYFVRA